MIEDIRYLSTEEFWEAMCSIYFRRLSRLTGILAGDLVYTLEAPEDRNGFISGKLNECASNLR